MATKKANNLGLTVTLPSRLVSAVQSRSNPTQSGEVGTVIQNRTLHNLMNNTQANYRTASNVPELVRHLARAEGPLSAAVHNIVQVANGTHRVTAYTTGTHEFNSEGTAMAMSILASMSTLYDYTKGFSSKRSEESLKSHMLREVVLTGGLSAELVLNEVQLPDSVQVVPLETIEMVVGPKNTYFPQQRVSGKNEPVKLNIPTFYVSLMQNDANSVYGFSMMDSALKLIIYFEEFMEDIRRSVRQNGHTRTVATLDIEKVKAAAPPAIRQDAVKLKGWMDSFRDGIQRQLESLSPEQAVVAFDICKLENLQAGLGSKVDYTPLLEVISGMYATAMKTPPSAIGMRLEGGSQALGNVESLIFLKTCAAVQTPVEDVMSRSLTLACRLHGLDVYVKFEFDPIELRPDMELESFKQMKQTRILEKLGLGMISDDEAAHLLGSFPRPPGAPNLSGTMFHLGLPKAEDTTTPGDTAMGRTLQPPKEVPRKAGGKSQ